MKSTNKNRGVVVGLFVTIGLVILVGTILLLGSQRKTFEKSIVVKAYFDNVSGLQRGNNIWFSGVKVGTIKNVKITEEGLVEVSMNIDQASQQFIRKDSKAKISTDGLIGNKIIEIYGGSLKLPQIEQDDILYADKMVSTDAMINTLSQNNDNLLAITTDFKTISSRLVEGKGTLGKLLSDESTMERINATTVTLQNAMNNFQKMSAYVADYTSKLNQKGSLAYDLVNDTSVFNNLRRTVSQLNEVANLSRKAVINFENAGNLLSGSMSSKHTPIGLLLNDEQTAENMKKTLQNLNDASKKLDEDLEALQHNFLFRGFFKNREKDQRVVLDTVVKK